ncbi:hypothetical protein GCM10009555_054580 [Acrocarpospora macrocephala]|uniref:Uncharacterized protein n=1 Tax=Acrocarpospora macrocephala TaxID=150177 RepID=A0A5M3X069_9ACTN|nr:hypothetical protein [Acrocarpospora macrocephala]GES14450.1 hypothetical protein Amac_080470 [Acrocarpospora macrocephala]
MTDTDPRAVAEPVTAGKVGARRAEMGQQLPDSVSLSLNVPQIRPAATARPEAATPSTADPTPAMLIWPPIEPPRRPDISDDLAENARRMNEAPPVNDVVAAHTRHDTSPETTPARPASETPPRKHRARYVTAAAVAAGVAALIRHHRRVHH